MRKLWSLLLLFCLSTGILLAQTEDKYLEGTVPVVDGKVTFSTEMNVGGMSKEQIHATLLEWSNNRFRTTDKFKARVLYNNLDEGSIAIAGDEHIVFSSTALALDRSRIYYQLLIYCETGKCNITMNRIRYWYQEERYGGEKYDAEEWITDDFSLNKSKTKLYPISGKFRRKTIDLKDELFKDIQATLGTKMIELGLQTAPVTPESKVIVSQPKPVQPVQSVAVAPATTPVVETQVVGQPAPAQADSEATDEESLIKQAVRMTITAGNDEQFEIGKECWGGFGEMFGQKVTFCFVDTQKTMGNMLMSQSESYRISFYLPNSNQAAIVIQCKKLMQNNISGEEAKTMNPNYAEGKSYNMYVGAVLK